MGTMGKGNYPGHWCDCEDLACYRVAELRELPEHYERPASWDKSKTEYADPRYPQPSATVMTAYGPVPAPGAKLDDWRGWKKVKGGIRAKPFAKWRRGRGATTTTTPSSTS
jgi:hypothetical protein